MNHNGTKVLKTEHLILRPMQVRDAEDMYRNWASDPEVTKYLTWQPHASLDVTRAILADWEAQYKDPKYYHWGMELDGQLVGTVGVVDVNERARAMELGYCMSRAYWGKGLMTEAVCAVRDYLIGEGNVNRLVIRHAVQNPASGRVATKCGFRQEGVLREAYAVSTGEPVDLAVHGLLKREWKEA